MMEDLKLTLIDAMIAICTSNIHGTLKMNS